MSNPGSEEKFYAIRRVDGEPMWGEYEWMRAMTADDWAAAEEGEHDEPTEYEIVEFHVHPVTTRWFGLWLCDDCSEPIPKDEEVTNDDGTFCKEHAGVSGE